MEGGSLGGERVREELSLFFYVFSPQGNTELHRAFLKYKINAD